MPTHNINTTIKLKRGNLDSTILAQGEPGYDTTDNVLKVGDGIHEYNELPELGSKSKESAFILLPDGTLCNMYSYNQNGLIVLLPKEITAIGYDCFKNNQDIVQIVQAPRTIASIGSGAFANCTKLITPLFSYTLTDINANTYQNCISFTNFIIPNNITTINQQAFSGCVNLTSVKFVSGATPPTLADINAFENCSDELIFYFPDQATLESFTNASNWCDLYNGNNFQVTPTE